MEISNKLLEKKEKLAVIGLGYVGMPIAIEFSKKIDVIGFDLNKEKVELYKSGIDPTNEVGNEVIKTSQVDFTANVDEIADAKVHIVAVPTPINPDKTPDLSPIENACHLIGKNIKQGSIIIFESTVYPGVTEDVCIPILESESDMICGKDFNVGYSPERINPGDKNNTLTKIVKIVSGTNKKTLNDIASIYEIIIKAGVHKASSIKVAEAAKVVENSQRDINIAFMNELAMVFDKMNIDTSEVIKAMSTKWNALNFYPGLVGGHCIGVDPYYFLYEAEKLGYHSQIILSGRKINDGMAKFVGQSIIKNLVLAGKVVKDTKIVIFGLTFKENTPDIRNTKVIDIIETLKEYEITPLVVDPLANREEAIKEYNVELIDMSEVKDADCLVFAVNHNELDYISWKQIENMTKKETQSKAVLIDIKNTINKKEALERGYMYWNL